MPQIAYSQRVVFATCNSSGVSIKPWLSSNQDSGLKHNAKQDCISKTVIVTAVTCSRIDAMRAAQQAGLLHNVKNY